MVSCDISSLTDCNIISLYVGQPVYFLIRSSNDSSDPNYQRMVRSSDYIMYPSIACPSNGASITITAPIQGELTIGWSHGVGNVVANLYPYHIYITSDTTFASTPLIYQVATSGK